MTPPRTCLRLFGLLLFAVLLIPCSSAALEVPPLAGRVNDLAGLLPVGAKQKLEEDLHRFEQETTHQIVVLTVPGLEGDGIEDFSIRVADAWKIGQQGIANGVILVVAQKERKIRIEVGRGFEGILPDAIASRIIREAILPRYRDGDYVGAIAAGVDSILEITRWENATKSPQILSRKPGSGFILWILIALAGACAVATASLFAGKAEGRPVRNAPVRRNSWPRDTIHYTGTGDGGGWGSSDFGGGGFGGDFGGGFSGGGGDFGGGGASGGDGGGSGGD